MEEYRSGKVAAGKYSRKPSQGYFALKMAGLKILAVGPVTPQADACICRLVASGCKVAFCDATAGSVYAQKSGTLFLPTDDFAEAFDMTADRWGQIDVVLLTVETESTIIALFRERGVARVIGLGNSFPDGLCDVVLNLKPSEDAAAANLCAVLCHPSTYCIPRINICLR